MKAKIYISCILILVGLYSESHAQVSFLKKSMGNLGAVPKAADMQNNGSLDNVDMSTGTLKIGIPLYEIKVNDISVPIMLNYSALGIKVGQEPGPVGMGWDLSAGGKILSNINGKPDNANNGISTNNMPLGITTLQPFTNDSHFGIIRDVLDGNRDGAWDTFNYSLPSGGGTYIQNGLTFPYDPLISIDHSAKVIRTTDGISYKFSPGDLKRVSKRKYYDNASNPPYYLPNGWTAEPDFYDFDLDEIISAKYKSSVKFNYQYFDYELAPDRPLLTAKTKVTVSESIPMYRDVQAAASASTNVLEYSQYDQIYKILEPTLSQSKTEYRHHTRIKDIVFPNGKVVFEYLPNTASHDVISTICLYKVTDGLASLLKRYLFVYDNNTQFGYYLKEINMYDANNMLQDYWAFTYINNFMPVVPNSTNFAQDRWGYYNGQTSNKTLLEDPNEVLALKNRIHYPFQNETYGSANRRIPYNRPENAELYGLDLFKPNPEGGVEYYYINFANRQFNSQSALYGTLNSIKTPTGGKYIYSYEPHKIRYTEYQPGTTNAVVKVEDGGGIRVRSITKMLGHNEMYQNIPLVERYLKKKYTYGEGDYNVTDTTKENNGVGIVSIPGNVLANRNIYGKASTLVGVNNILLLSHPVNNMVQYGGSYGIYTTATETILRDTLGQNNYGKTVYFSRALSYGNSPDNKWRDPAINLDNPGLPLAENNPGVKLEIETGVFASRKYAYANGAYSPVEENVASFTTFNAPQSTNYRAISFFGGITGQLSGQYPSSPFSTPVVNDFPVPEPRGGNIVNLFNSVQSSSNNAGMDYITRSLMAPEGNTINYDGKYYSQLLDLNQLSNCIRKSKDVKTVFSNGYAIVDQLETKYSYANPLHLLPTKIASINAKGDSIFNRIKYPQDYVSPAEGTLTFMKNNKIGLAERIEEFSTHNAGIQENTEYLISASLNTFKIIDGAAFNDKSYSRKISGISDGYDGGSGYNGDNAQINLDYYKQQVSYDLYSDGNLHKYSENAAPGNVIVWGYNNQLPVAKVTNTINSSSSQSTDVCYTSFEMLGGNWTYSGVPQVDETSISGRKVYDLGSGNVTKSNITVAGKYVVSYWYKSGSTVLVSGGTVGAEVVRNTRGSWILAEREISGTINSVIISGTGKIDELRFHPFESQMTTYTYDPMIGLSGSIDQKGNAQYYEYDASQQLKNIRDQDGNIVKSYKYIIGSAN